MPRHGSGLSELGDRMDRDLEDDTVPEDCPRCHGSGDAPCTRCHGLGYIEMVDSVAGIYHETCVECGGCREVVCPGCSGTGDKP